ncbi:MAG TPA: AGE family epimerase/isomerase, partial [Puia sp.]|nr:AGE family epimerase/isomerase [Puia sp.]
MWNEIQLKQALCDELRSILNYWADNTVDTANGGFVGRIDGRNAVHTDAPKGAVLHARILWTFSAGHGFFGEEKYRKLADRAFIYIRDHFIDAGYGGVFWTVDSQGHMLDPKKQIYALAFCIYGLSEYYGVTKKEEALTLALGLYEMIEKYSYDERHGGYLEAFARDWATAEDVRLSEKDANEKKTMNTHLHIIEAYANLYKVCPSEGLKRNISELLGLFDLHFIHRESFHLRLFFDEQWNERKDV